MMYMHHELEEMACRVPAQCLGTAVRQLARRVTQTYDYYLGVVGLTLSQFNVMSAILLLQDEASAARIGRHLDADRSTISREIALLVSREFVELGSTQGRTQCLGLSEKGERVYLRAWEAWETACGEIDRTYGVERSRDLCKTIHGMLG